MSAESTDSESIPMEDRSRSRSIFRQVRRSLSRNRSGSENHLAEKPILNKKFPPIDDQYKTKSLRPTAYSHRLSLLSQVKSHFINQRKHRPNRTSFHYDDQQCLIAPIPSPTRPVSETKASPNIEETSPSPSNGTVDRLIPRSLSIKEDSTQAQGFLPEVTRNSSATTNRRSLNKFKDQFTQRARTVLTKSPSLTSLISNSSAPSSPEQVFWTELCIERGKDLSVKDMNGTSDPYVKVFYGTEEKYTTNTVTKSLNPLWNEKFTFFTHDLQIPIYFQVFDHDRIGRDESMGSTKIDLSQIPLDTSYSATLELENEGRNDGKTGTLKINISLSPKSIEFRDEVLRTLARQTLTKSLFNGRSGANQGVISARKTIDVFVIEGRNLLMINGNKTCSPYVRIKFANNKKNRTQTIKGTTNPIWYQSFMYDTTVAELPPLELTVMDETNSSGDFLGRGVCPINDLEEERTHRISVQLEDGAGVVDLFVTITGTTPLQEATNDGDSSANVVLDVIPSRLTETEIQHYKFFSTIRSMNPVFDVGRLEIKIYQARDLSAKDIGGKSDPFCIVELDSTRLRTHTIYKTLDPVWNKSFVIPVQDIHSVVQLTIYDEDTNKSNEFIGKIVIPLLAIKNGEKKWMVLKDRKCLLPVKGAIEIEATLVYANLKAVIRTFNPRQISYYQTEGKFSVGAIKQHIARIQNMLKGVFNVFKFIDYCFQWENPMISFMAFMASLLMVWNFQLYMLPCSLLLIFARNAVVEYRRGRLGRYYASLGDETISAAVQPSPVDEDNLESEANAKEPKKSFVGMIQGLQETVLEIQGYIDSVASTLERVKNLFNFTVPWLSVLLIIILMLVAVLLYYVPLRYLILAFVINKFTKRFRKPKGYIDNNELADFMSRLPSDTELMQYRELRLLLRLPTPKKSKRTTANGK